MTDDTKNKLGQTNATDDSAQSQPFSEQSRHQSASEQGSAEDDRHTMSKTRGIREASDRQQIPYATGTQKESNKTIATL